MTAPLSRRNLLSILPAGCLGCAAARCVGQTPPPPATHDWTEKSDMTWEGIFGFAFGRCYIPAMKSLAAQIGEEKLVAMLKEGMSEARRGMARRPPPRRDLDAWAGFMRNPPPLFQHALAFEIVEDSPQAFELRISKCLWAKTFRENDAAAIGYASLCHTDFADVSAFNPKIKLIRTKTLMQGNECCNHRYVLET
jgi:hypothetical protein